MEGGCPAVEERPARVGSERVNNHCVLDEIEAGEGSCRHFQIQATLCGFV